MSDTVRFTNPIVVEADHYYFLRERVERYNSALSNWDSARERKRQYLRGIGKTDLEPDPHQLEQYDQEIRETEIELAGTYYELTNDWD